MVSEYHQIPESMQQTSGGGKKKPQPRGPKHPTPARLRNIALVGMPGAGKSAVAKALASLMHREWLEIDALVEEAEGMKVPEIFKQRGEDYFRKKESEKLAEVLAGTEKIISTGGGAVLAAENRRLLRMCAWVVYLAAPITVLRGRIANDSQVRPLLDGKPEKILAEISIKRAPFYRQTAHLVVVQRDSDTPGRVARKAEAGLKQLMPV